MFRKSTKNFFLIATFLLSLNVVEASQGKDTVIIAMGNTSEPETGFDPAFGWGAGEHVHEPLIQSTLTVTTQDLKIGYDLATDIQVSEDGMQWIVTIRDDVFFTDGKPLTAEDVAFTYNKVKELSTVNDFTMLDRAEAKDNKTVVFYMNTPYSIWPYSMANVGIVPKHAYNENYGQNPIGSGRYMLQQWDKGQQIILKANPNYYGEAPKMKNVVVLFMGEDAAFAAAKAKKVDVAYTTPTLSQEKVKGYDIFAAHSVDNRGFNLPAVSKNGAIGNDVTSDIAIREAINVGIDRDRLIKYILKGYGTPAYSVADKMPWYNEKNVVSYDLDKAKKILDDAGWKTGKNGIREKNGIQAKFNMLYPASDSVRQALAAETSNQLKDLGISVTFEGVGWDTAYDRAQSEPLMWGWGAHTPMEMYNIYHTAPNANYALYSPYTNKEVDKLMDEALATNDLNISFDLWKKSQEKLAEEVPWIWLVNIDHLYWVKNGLNVAEQKIHPHGHGWSLVNNVDKWYWSSN
jgi:peptide/nickel transport system substrate-binding protein